MPVAVPYVRASDMVYPNGRTIDFDYNAGADDAMSRVSDIKDDNSGTHLADYTYLGAGTIATQNYTEPGLKLDYTGTSDDFSWISSAACSSRTGRPMPAQVP